MNLNQAPAALRQEMIALCLRNIDQHVAASQTEKGAELFVIFTGDREAPVWINVEAVKRGAFSISLNDATRYSSRAVAAQVATLVKNGHNQPGHAITLAEARAMEIVNNQRMLAQISEVTA